MLPAYQHPRDLTLALFSGEPTFPMTLLRSHRLNVGRWDVHFHIIGESHAAIFSYEREPVFSEVLACVDVKRAMYTYKFASLEQHQVVRGGYAVAVTADVVNWHIPCVAETLQLDFPKMFGQKPVTRIQWHYDNHCLQWWTLHTYPLEGDLIEVKTMSYFDFSGGKQWV
jgi:hypothetical protein